MNYINKFQRMDERDHKAMNDELKQSSLEEKAENEYPVIIFEEKIRLFGTYKKDFNEDKRNAFIKGHQSGRQEALQEIEEWAKDWRNTSSIWNLEESRFIYQANLLTKLSELKTR